MFRFRFCNYSERHLESIIPPGPRDYILGQTGYPIRFKTKRGWRIIYKPDVDILSEIYPDNIMKYCYYPELHLEQSYEAAVILNLIEVIIHESIHQIFKADNIVVKNEEQTITNFVSKLIWEVI